MILDKLITLTIEEEEMYPSIQAKIWGNIGQVCGNGARILLLVYFCMHIHELSSNIDFFVPFLMFCLKF